MKKKSAVFTLILLIAGIVLMLFAGYRLVRIFMDYHSSNALYDQVEESYVKEATEVEEGEESVEVPWYELVSVDLDGLRKENSDVVGWIYFENESISYPVMYSGDDEAYLRTAMDGSSATAGSIFMEGANTPDFEDCHTIIYGHNMRNLSMFGKLKYYKEQDDYYEDHMYFQIIKDGVAYRYQIFAYADVPADSFVYEVPFAANADFASFLADIYKASYVDTGVIATKDDKVITLSTCSSGDNRFVVHAMRVDSHVIGE